MIHVSHLTIYREIAANQTGKKKCVWFSEGNEFASEGRGAREGWRYDHITVGVSSVSFCRHH